MTATKDNDAIVGDECHIQAKQSGGARNNLSMSVDELDDYENLILLCKTHHKMVDDQPNTFPVAELKMMKKKHEKWVQETLQGSTSDSPTDSLEFLSRITTGKELFSIITGIHFSDIDYDEPNNKDELEFLSGFIQNLSDWADIGHELELGQKVEAGHNLSQEIRKLEEKGFVIFGKRETSNREIQGVKGYWEIATIRILHSTNPTIIKIDLPQLSDKTKDTET